MLVLDTHVWIWLVIGDATLSADARGAIEHAARTGSVLVPAISVWEVAMLESRGRITPQRGVLFRCCGRRTRSIQDPSSKPLQLATVAKVQQFVIGPVVGHRVY